MSSLFCNVGRRYVTCYFVFAALFLVYAMRINLSIAVVSMTSAQPVELPNGTIIKVQEFDWGAAEKGYLLSSFYGGYVVSELPAGWLSRRFGGATMLTVVITCTSISTLLLPLVATQGIYAVVIFRAIVGIFEGGSYPCAYTIFSRWAPSEERSTLLSIALTGPYFATAICLAVYGVLAHCFGWRTIFYLPGILGLIWVMLWIREGRNDPKNDPRITRSELEYLKNTVGEKYDKKIIYPWKKMLTSLPVWSIIVANIGECWGYTSMFTELPTVLNDLYHFNEKDAGMLLSIPYMIYAMGAPIAGMFADYLRIRKGVTTTRVRKIFNSICYFGQAVCMILVVCSNSATQTIITLCLWTCFACFVMGGYFANFLDIAPAYAGVLMGIANTIGILISLFSPIVTGHIVTNKTKAEWSIVFLISGIIYFTSASFYLIFSSGNIQDWAIISQDGSENANDKENGKQI